MHITMLPMEVWAVVARHLPFRLLLDTFWALRRAGALPDTHTNASNAFLQFCSQIEADDVDDTRYHVEEEMRISFVEMGFDLELVDRAVQLCRGDAFSTFEYLVLYTESLLT